MNRILERLEQVDIPELVVQDLAKFMLTDEWFAIIGVLSLAQATICLHTFDDSLGDGFTAVELTGSGFVDEKLKPISNLKIVLAGFVEGYGPSLDPSGREPQQLIPWIQERTAVIKRRYLARVSTN